MRHYHDLAVVAGSERELRGCWWSRDAALQAAIRFEPTNVWVMRHDGLSFSSGWYIDADAFTQHLASVAEDRYRERGLAGYLLRLRLRLAPGGGGRMATGRGAVRFLPDAGDAALMGDGVLPRPRLDRGGCR
ncbi:MAG: hypothetical protein OXC99_11455 [Chloroflexi bacterium]|nr:hypothetical protein [Chloroflexota bacterium]